MKLLNTIVYATVVGTSLIAALPTLGLSNLKDNPIQNLVAISGNCVGNFILYDKLLPTPQCESLLNTGYKDGRTGFYFSTDKYIVTFSGISPQVSTSKNSVVQPINLLLISNTQKSNTSQATKLIAAGTCSFANPYMGIRVFVQCDVETSKGRFMATFESDASEPTILIRGGDSISQ